jgi:hypothetical protein
MEASCVEVRAIGGEEVLSFSIAQGFFVYIGCYGAAAGGCS